LGQQEGVCNVLGVLGVTSPESIEEQPAWQCPLAKGNQRQCRIKHIRNTNAAVKHIASQPIEQAILFIRG